MRLPRRSRLLVALAASVVVVPFVPQAQAARGELTIAVLSGRADLISGGDALVAISLADRSRPAKVTLHHASRGHDVTRDLGRSFSAGAPGELRGLVTGLPLGDSTLSVVQDLGRAAGSVHASLTLTNHPLGGPVFAGPQIRPWTCAEGTTGPQCDKKPVYEYVYKPVGGGDFQEYNRDAPPPAETIASTTTQTGVTVPFIVRTETGFMDRDEYRIAALFQPGRAWTALRPQPQFNHKLVLTHGASCDTEYGSGSAPDVMNAAALGAGFVVASHALDNAGHNCNILTQAESLIMTKERVVEQYGTLRYTIGSGCSGGSLVQQQVANAYPGVYQGISPQCSFTDARSIR
jgi:hypothetical protein